MSRKKQKQERPPKAPEFATRPFAAIKALKADLQEQPAPAAPPPPKRPVKAREPEDDLLFLREMEGVARLNPPRKSRKRPAGEEPYRPGPPGKPALDPEERRLFLDTLAKLRLDVSFADELPAGEEPLRPRGGNRLRQLQRGVTRIDLELDLHGLSREEALTSLASFVTAAHRRGQRAVLVITGKGNNSPGEPVLLTAVAGWLREQGRGMVAEFAPAPRNLGGSGAFVVFLKVPKNAE